MELIFMGVMGVVERRSLMGVFDRFQTSTSEEDQDISWATHVAKDPDQKDIAILFELRRIRRLLERIERLGGY